MRKRRLRFSGLLAGLRWFSSALVIAALLLISYIVYAFFEYHRLNDTVESLVFLPVSPAGGGDSREVTLVAIDTARQSVLTLRLAPNVVIPLAQGRGTGRAGSLAGLETEPGFLDRLVKDSFQETLGWPIDNVILAQNETGLPELIIKQAINFKLNWWQAWISLKALNNQGFRSESLSGSRFTQKLADVDGIWKEEWSPARWDHFVQTSGIVTRLNEGIGVSAAIVNNTDQAGLGALAGRMLTNNGFDVVSIKSADQAEAGQGEIIWANQDLKNHYRQKLNHLFPELSQAIDPDATGRADLILYLGETTKLRW